MSTITQAKMLKHVGPILTGISALATVNIYIRSERKKVNHNDLVFKANCAQEIVKFEQEMRRQGHIEMVYKNNEMKEECKNSITIFDYFISNEKYQKCIEEKKIEFNI